MCFWELTRLPSLAVLTLTFAALQACGAPIATPPVYVQTGGAHSWGGISRNRSGGIERHPNATALTVSAALHPLQWFAETAERPWDVGVGYRLRYFTGPNRGFGHHNAYVAAGPTLFRSALSGGWSVRVGVLGSFDLVVAELEHLSVGTGTTWTLVAEFVTRSEGFFRESARVVRPTRGCGQRPGGPAPIRCAPAQLEARRSESFGVAYGETSLGAFAEVSYQAIAGDVYWLAGAGLLVRLPLAAGLVRHL